LAVDATTVCETGKTGSVWRVHWCVNLANLQCAFFALTDVHGGEKLARFPIQAGDLILGDRGYSNATGIDSVCRRGGEVLVRLNPLSLPLYRSRGDVQRINVLAELRGLPVGELRTLVAWVKGSEGHWHRGRVVAVRRSKAATLRELRQRRWNAKYGERRAGKQAKAMARYLLVWTSLRRSELPARRVLRYYRYRWQLELVFKRCKSIMGLGQLPKHSDASSRAWLAGKLLVAMLVEKIWQQAEAFSPWGYALPATAKSLA